MSARLTLEEKMQSRPLCSGQHFDAAIVYMAGCAIRERWSSINRWLRSPSLAVMSVVKDECVSVASFIEIIALTECDALEGIDERIMSTAKTVLENAESTIKNPFSMSDPLPHLVSNFTQVKSYIYEAILASSKERNALSKEI